MILYVDTSALVKAYVSEEGSAEVLRAMRGADKVATHLIAYVEAHAAFARQARDGKIGKKQGDAIRQEFTQDWQRYLQVGIGQALVERAAALADAFALRAYDSVHLAAADFLHHNIDGDLAFACFDRNLNRAASVLGLRLATD